MLVPTSKISQLSYPVKLAIFGSTGSIGESTLQIVRQNPDKFLVKALVAGSNQVKLLDQVKEFKPEFVALSHCNDKNLFIENVKSVSSSTKTILVQQNSAELVASDCDYDLMVAGIVGIAGLKSVYTAIRLGKNVALANKESLVCGGSIITDKAKQTSSQILPVDSEHSAIWQSILGNNHRQIKSVIITASGGAFLHTPQEKLVDITKAQALKHPNWSMGAKVTVDSSTLFNKALEVIEAKWLFALTSEKIEVLIHPESIIHSMVRYQDGVVMMQASVPDMKQAIGFAVNYPAGRLSSLVKDVDFETLAKLNFFKPDINRFPAIKLVRDVLSKKDESSAGVAFNCANEIAVEKFLNDQIKWIDIYPKAEAIYTKFCDSRVSSIDDIIELDNQIRQTVG